MLLAGRAWALPTPVAPLPFVANQGQWPHAGQFVATVPGGWLFLEPGGFTYNLQPARSLEPVAASAAKPAGAAAAPVAGHAYRVRLLGANPTPVLTGEDRQLAYHNYFLGNDAAHWVSRVLLFGGVRYQQVYAGVDVRWHQAAQAGQLEYDFEVAPGADAGAIRLRYEGLSEALALTADGHLRLRTSVGEVREQAPVAWQTTPQGQRRALACRFVLGGAAGNEVSFRLGAGYDARQPLTIDPTLVFATYSGSIGGMSANATAPDAQGNMYTSGYTLGPQFPVTTGAYKTIYVSGNMAIAKLAADGKTELFATYLGSASLNNFSTEYPLDLKVDPAGNVLVLGTTISSDYPTTAGAYDRSFNGDQDYVLTCLSSTGDRLVASTFLGGSGHEGGDLSSIPASLEIDPGSGDVLVAGTTLSGNYPVLNAMQGVNSGNFRREGVLTRFSPDLSALRWSTYLGGAAEDEAHCVKVAPNGEVYVSGRTSSSNFPVGVGGLLPAAPGGGSTSLYDGFVLRLSAAGQRLGGTYLGTPANDVARFLDFDPAGNVLVCGATEGAYPITTGAYSAVVPGASSVFVHCLSPALSATVFSTRLSIIGSPILGSCNLLTAFGRDDCGRLYLCAYGARIVSPGAPCTADALSKEAGTFYAAVLSDNTSSLLYGSFVGERGTSPLPDFTVHLHFAAAGKITRQGTLYQLACTTGKQFGTTPGAYGPSNRSFGNDGVGFRFDLAPTSAVPGARASIAAVPAGCAPYTAQFAAVGASSRLTYRWDFGDGSPADLTATPSHTYAAAGTYTVRLLVRQPPGGAACGLPRDSTTATVRVQGRLPAPLAQVPAVVPGCAPYRVQFGNQSTGAALRYRWNFGDGSPIDTTAAPGHTYAAAGTYAATLTVIQPNGVCGAPTSTAQQAVVVYSVPPALAGQIGLQPPACVGTTVLFGVQHNGAQLFSWDFGDGTPADPRTAPSHAYAAPGTYLVRLRLTRPATNNCDQGQALATLLLLVQAPRATRQVLDSLDCRQQLLLDPALPGTTATAWASGEKTRTLLITAPGRYRALVTVANEACPVPVEFEIKQGQLRALANIITPNGDGRNDVFSLPASYGTPELRIFNRWGRLVYQTAAYTNDWSAPGLPPDLYYYHLRRPDCNLLLKGWVEVVR